MSEPPPRLIIGIGNPSRGDDALGPTAIERLATMNLAATELLGDFQLQVEYVLDLRDRRELIIIDATLSGPESFSFEPVHARADDSHSSHVLSPAALLHAYARLYGPPPPTHVLAIRGYHFELGEGLSSAALANLDAALAHLLGQMGVR